MVVERLARTSLTADADRRSVGSCLVSEQQLILDLRDFTEQVLEAARKETSA